MLRVYIYDKCDTCRRALKFLAAHRHKPEVLPIRAQPPTRPELKRMLGALGGDLRKLFNTSGQEYRRLGLKEKLPTFTEAQALDLLASNGSLIKRPFLVSGKEGAVGFKEEEWRRLLRSESET